MAAPCVGLLARSSREFAPAGDLLFVSTKSRQKATPAKPPLRCASGCPAMLEARGQRQTPFAHCVRCGQTVALSQLLKRAARAPWVAALLGGFEGEAQNSRNSQQPSASTGWRRLFLQSPLEPAEQRKALRARAQHASSSDSAQLFDRSVAEGVLRGPSRPEQRREAGAKRKAGRIGGRLFAYFLVAQKVGRPPGRTPGMGLASEPAPCKSTPRAPQP
jgi:hypothetical protein